MGPTVTTDELAAACSRLTGDPGRRVRHGIHFRVKVKSSDGKPATAVVQIDVHPGDVRPYVLNYVADCWRLPREKLEEALANWAHDDLVRHLQQFTQEQLKSPALRKC